MWCAVFNCKSTSRYATNDKKTHFYAFPKDVDLRSKWLTACRRKEGDLKFDKAFICENHFEQECFENRMTQKTKKNPVPKMIKRLVSGSVPKLNLELEKIRMKRPSKFNDPNSEDGPPKRMPRTGIPTYQELLASAKEEKNVEEAIFIDVSEFETTADINASLGNALQEDPLCFIKRIKQLEEMNKRLRQQSTKDKTTIVELQETVGLLTELRIEMEKKLKVLQKSNREFEPVAKALENIFTPGQIKRLRNPLKTKIRWCAQDIAAAVTLRSKGRKAYLYLMNEMKVPLPPESTLRHWLLNFKVSPGLLHDVFLIMKDVGATLNAAQRLTVLCFEEIDISHKVEPMRREQKSHEYSINCQFVMARGLFSTWRQPVFYQFDRPMNKALLNDLIITLSNIGYDVVCITNSISPANMTLWEELGIAQGRCWFRHPADYEKQIFVMADVLQLIKTLRTTYIENGFQVDGECLDKQILDKLLDLDQNDLKISFSLTKTHLLDVQCTEKQKVGLAAQMFSLTNASAVAYCGQAGLLTDNWEQTAYMIELINNWFDILNSTTKFNRDNSTYAYGLDLKKQHDILDDMSGLMEKMRVIDPTTSKGKEQLEPFQKGIILTNKSLKNMFAYIQKMYTSSEFTPKYFLTRRLCLDVVWSFVAQIQTLGALHYLSSPVEVQNRVRWCILSKYANAVVHNKNNDADFGTTAGVNMETFHNFKTLVSELGEGDERKKSESENEEIKDNSIIYDSITSEDAQYEECVV